jgi:hypothetical protein
MDRHTSSDKHTRSDLVIVVGGVATIAVCRLFIVVWDNGHGTCACDDNSGGAFASDNITDSSMVVTASASQPTRSDRGVLQSNAGTACAACIG